jgi:hypothetical protein
MILVEFLKVVGDKLDAKGLHPKNIESGAAFFKLLTEGSDGEMLMTQQEIEAGMKTSTDKVKLVDPDHLYVAGKVLHMYDLWSKPKVESGAHATGEVRTAERLRITDGSSYMLRYIEVVERMVT